MKLPVQVGEGCRLAPQGGMLPASAGSQLCLYCDPEEVILHLTLLPPAKSAFCLFCISLAPPLQKRRRMNPELTTPGSRRSLQTAESSEQCLWMASDHFKLHSVSVYKTAGRLFH